jgi:hypothetical protein
MNVQLAFGLSVLLSFIASGIVGALYVWPRVRLAGREDGLLALVIPHMFRFVGLSFLIPGVVAPGLPAEFTHPAAYGDLVASLLALASFLALRARFAWALVLVWALNLWGATDLLFAIYQGQIGVGIDASMFGAAFFIPTVFVPMLLVSHALMFLLLLRRS